MGYHTLLLEYCVCECLPHNYRSILVDILLSPPVFYYHSVCVKPNTDVLFIVTLPSLTNLWSVRRTGPFLKKKFYTGYLTLFKVACRSMYTLVHNATVLKSDTVLPATSLTIICLLCHKHRFLTASLPHNNRIHTA